MKNKNTYKPCKINEYLLDAWWGFAVSIISLLGFSVIGVMAWVLGYPIYMKLLAMVAVTTFFVWLLIDIYRIYEIKKQYPINKLC